MKWFLITLIVLTISCSASRYCTEHKRYLKKVDISKSYRVKGAYCIAGVKDTLLPESGSLVKFRVFDPVTGQAVESGFIRLFGSDTVKTSFDKNKQTIASKPGKYAIEAYELGYMESRTPILTLKPNQVVMINFYLGVQVDY